MASRSARAPSQGRGSKRPNNAKLGTVWTTLFTPSTRFFHPGLRVRRIPTGTPMAIAGHRDTFFRPLKDIKVSDMIRFTTPENTTEYRVVSTKIVGPTDTWVLDDRSENKLTLITCYPFYYVGPAPKRFIVEAVKN